MSFFGLTRRYFPCPLVWCGTPQAMRVWAHFRQGGHKLQEGLRSWNPQGQAQGQGQGQGPGQGQGQAGGQGVRGGRSPRLFPSPTSWGLSWCPRPCALSSACCAPPPLPCAPTCSSTSVQLLQQTPENMDIFLKVPPLHCTVVR